MGKHEKPSPFEAPQTVSDDTWTRFLLAAVDSGNGEQWTVNAVRCAENAKDN